jgi:tetratricopeptide (TPR) repeat protein
MQLNMEEIAKTSSDYSGGSGPRIRKHSSSSAGSGQGHGTNNVRTWQSILDGLTIKARKDGLLRAVQNERGFEARIRKVLDSIAVRNKLSSWISQCSETHYAKSGSTATRLRDEGNLKFRAHDNEGSLRLYTESVICAPEFGPELSLALANRSACLYHQAQYETCLQDISLSLQFRYPKNLEYKLLQRKAQCLTKLSRFKEAEEAFKAANDALDFVPKLSPEKRGRLIKDNEALLRENNIGAGLQLLSEARVENERLKKEQNATLEENMSRSLKLTDNKTSNATSCDINKQPLINFSSDVKFKVPPAYGVNPTFCSASAAIECVDANSTDMCSNTDPGSASKDNILKESKIRGRHVVANQNIDVGSVLFSELPYSSVLLPEHYSTHCHQCYTSLIAPIPCLRCTQPRYCSDQVNISDKIILLLKSQL